MCLIPMTYNNFVINFIYFFSENNVMETHHICTMIVIQQLLKVMAHRPNIPICINSYTMAVRDFADMKPLRFRCIYQQNHTTQSWYISLYTLT